MTAGLLEKRRGAKPASDSRREGNALLRSWCGGIEGRVLSVGSGTDSDHEGGRYRDYFPSVGGYVTSDLLPGCDLVLDVQDLSGVTERYAAVFCHSVLEHVVDPWGAVRELGRVLRAGGALILAVPFVYKIHRAPTDYWRFTQYGVRQLLSAAELEPEAIVGVGGPETAPAVYIVRARKP